MTSSRLIRSTLAALCVLALHSLVACERAEQEPTRGRVLIIGIDGATHRLIDPLIQQGRLPHLAGLQARGASGTIRAAIPIDSPRIWNTMVTGKTPNKHGIQHFAKKVDGRNELYLSSDRRAHALWNIVSDAGMTVGVVNFWNTFPPEEINGVMISDHLLARNIEGRRRIMRAEQAPEGPLIHPADWQRRIADLLATPKRLSDIPNPLRNNPGLPPWLGLVGDDVPRRFEEDETLARIALEIEREVRPDLMMVLLPGIDRTQHFLWGSLEDPQLYDEELRLSPAQQKAGREALEAYYQFTDQLIGHLIASHGDDDLVIVLSDHGFEAGRGMGLLTGIHKTEAAIEGVFYAAGRGIAPGTRVEGLGIADLTPSVLAWLGLPVGEDMDGKVGAFLGAVEVTTTPTHDIGEIARMPLERSGAEAELVDQLEALGYLE